jgi:hypothetical protein
MEGGREERRGEGRCGAARERRKTRDPRETGAVVS